jgi:hypothetical protein
LSFQLLRFGGKNEYGFAPISHSQEELLQRKKKNKKSLKDPFPEVTSAYNHHTDFLVDIQGIAHAPIQETYSLPVANVHLPNCSFNTADDYDYDDDNLHFMDFGNDSDSGFLENNLHCSLNVSDDETLDLMDFGNDSHLGFQENLPCSSNIADHGPADKDSDEIRLSESETSDLGQPPQKKMKSLEMNGNVVSGVDAINNDGCGEIPRRTEQEKKFLVFDVLRMLAENANKVEDENKNPTLLEIAKSSGITFPRPSWRPKEWKSEIFNFHD